MFPVSWLEKKKSVLQPRGDDFCVKGRVKSTRPCMEENPTIKITSTTADFFMGSFTILKTMMPMWTLINLKAVLEGKRMESWYYRKTLNVFCMKDNSVAEGRRKHIFFTSAEIISIYLFVFVISDHNISEIIYNIGALWQVEYTNL